MCACSRRGFMRALSGVALAAPTGALPQATTRVFRIGYLAPETEAASLPRVHALRAGFKEIGYVEGRNLAFDVRFANGRYADLPALAAQLVSLKVDALVIDGDKASLAAQRATTTIPIVIGSTSDPVGLGLAASLVRPGGNITGLTAFAPELVVKRIQLLKEIAPNGTRIALLLNPQNPAADLVLKGARAVADQTRVSFHPLWAGDRQEIESAFASITKKDVDAVDIQNDTLFYADANLARIASLAAERRLLSSGRVEYVDAGGLLGYGTDNLELFRRAAVLVDKIFKGAHAGDIPFERASKFDLALNLKVARALGIELPKSLMLRATKLVD